MRGLGGECAHAIGMDNTEALKRLDRFRHSVYDRVLGHRKDTMFELMEAVLVANGGSVRGIAEKPMWESGSK